MSTLLAGAAAHNAGRYGVARTIWTGSAPVAIDSDGVDGAADDTEDTDTADDSRLLDGLAAFAAAVTESRRGNWAAALDAASEAEQVLGAVDDARIDLHPIERWLTAFGSDPAVAERSPPPTLTVDGDRPTPGELPLSSAAVVAGAVAAAAGDDSDVIADALRFAAEDEHPETTRYATFVRDYAAADPSDRPIISDRLSAVVAQQRRKEEDVEGLFDGS
mgnify:CR=1 FL=1